MIELYLPFVPVIRSASDSAIYTHNALVEQHVDFIVQLHIARARSNLVDRASREIKAVSHSFPHVRDYAVILVMAAWFSYLCVLDDCLEQLRVHDARTVLTHCAAWMHCAQHSIARDCEAGIQKKRRLTVSGYEAGGLYIERITACLTSAVRSLLQVDDVYVSFRNNVRGVLCAMLDEIELREDGECDIKRYISIRSRTIGLTPFFGLLRATLGLSMPVSNRSKELEALAAHVIGMHNDILGLDKDVRSRETMNFVILHSQLTEGSLRDLAKSFKLAVRMSNRAVLRAVQCYEAVEMEGNDVEKEYCRQLLILIHQHYSWASSAQRYE